MGKILVQSFFLYADVHVAWNLPASRVAPRSKYYPAIYIQVSEKPYYPKIPLLMYIIIYVLHIYLLMY